jgi:hypothetical protein
MWLYFLSNLGMGGGGATVTNYDLITAVQQWWLGQSTLQALFSDSQLHHKSAPEDTLLPYATYFKVSDVAETLNTAGQVRRASVQFSVHAQTDAQAQSIGDAFSDALNTIKQGAPISINVYGKNAMVSLPGESGINIGEGLAPGAEDCWVFHFTINVPYNK